MKESDTVVLAGIGTAVLLIGIKKGKRRSWTKKYLTTRNYNIVGKIEHVDNGAFLKNDMRMSKASFWNK